MAVVFALIAFFAWGLADLFAALSSRKIGNLSTFVILQVTGMVIAAILFPFFAGTFLWEYFLFAFILATIDNLGLIFFYKAFEKGNVALNGTIGGSFGLVIVVMAVVIFGERVSIGAGTGIACIFIGIVLSSLKLKELFAGDVKASFADKGVVFALLTMLCWGVYFSLIRIPVGKIGWYWTWMPLNFMLPFAILFPGIRHAFQKIVRNISLGWYAVLHAVSAIGGTIAYNLGLLSGNSTIVGPIATASPALFVVLSRFVFRDRLNKQQWVGIVLTLGGMVLISIS